MSNSPGTTKQMGTAMIGSFFRKKGERPQSFLGALVRDVTGNTLAIMAIALIPLAGMVGGGIDLSRLYLVKTRLQHACDAGALAGRKAQGGGQWSQNSYAPRTTANQFFNANFVTGSYGAQNLQSNYTEDAGKVTGVASATVPLTLVKVITASTMTTVDLSVRCDAEMRLPNTDVMFVLDVTGSMASTLPGDTQSKISALKTSVKCFYEVLAKLNTTASCATGNPSGGVGSQVQVRFGFVPYDTNVNVGRLLPTEFLADNWTYQTRERTTVYGTFLSWSGTTVRNAQAWPAYADDPTIPTVDINKNQTCTLPAIPGDVYAINGDPASWPDQETATQWRVYMPANQRNYQRTSTTSGNTKTCKIQYRDRQLERLAFYSRSTASATGAIPFRAWTYKPVSVNVAPLKAGSGVNWNNSMTMNIGNSYSDVDVPWAGCIAERPTVRQASYTPIPAGAKDLDIDLVPTAADVTTQWGPALPSIIYPRKDSYTNSGSYSLNEITTFNQTYTSSDNNCTTEAKKLQEWPSTTDFETYVDSLTPGANTYHDIGVLWGARLMSPTGIFASENAVASLGGEIQRHMIFMTDGEACTGTTNYTAYGSIWYDRAQTDPSVVPTTGCGTTGTQTEQVNARTAALCTAIKNKNITLWVIWFGASNPTIEAQLTSCASPSRFYTAGNSAQLQTTFASIANQIAQLRLTG